KNGEVLEAVNDVRTVVFDKTGTITVGQPQVTDIIGDRNRVLQVAASLESGSEHPLASAILDQAQTDQVVPQTVDQFQAVEGQGVTATVNHQLAFVGNHKLASQ